MDFISNQEQQNRELLQAIGVASIEELFRDIPKRLRLPRPEKDDGLSEFEGLRYMETLAAKNTFPAFDNYLGAGAYEHHVPALVGAICSKSEFLTSYTPYQAEASQGMLQVIFEFQSAICALTDMDAANASVYDGASACAEAMLMALRAQAGKKKLVISRALHPHYRGVVEQYLASQAVEIVDLPFNSQGTTDLQVVKDIVDNQTAAVLLAYPSILGTIDDLAAIHAEVHDAGALAIVCANPLVYGLFTSAAEIGADIAVGDCQPFGLPLQFGGPYAGYIACRQELLRQLPGRIAGETVDAEGKRGFVLTLQAREQHIRREKATSNICTNQALAALASLVAMLWYGRQGVPQLALTNYQRAAYLRQELAQIKGIRPYSEAPFFNEFAMRFEKPIELVQKQFRQHNIEPGVWLGRWFPELTDVLLIAVTETKSIEQLDRYVGIARSL